MINGLIKKNKPSTIKGDSKLNTLKKIYDLPVTSYEEQVDRNFFNYVKQRHFFLVLTVFDPKGRILIVRDFSKNHGWELPGGSIKAHDIDNIFSAAQNVINRMVRTELYDVQPIALIQNNFYDQKGKKFIHQGIALIARTSGRIEASQDIEWGFFLKLPETMFTANRKIAALGLEIFSRKKYKPAVNEVTSSETVSWRYKFHQLIVNKTIGLWPSWQLKQAIMQVIGRDARTILDTSCGDDKFALSLARSLQPNLLVCNDISTRHLDFLSKKALATHMTHILFTNHDILDLPFTQKFDIAISKNTLHHLNADQDKKTVIKNLRRLATKSIIVDIEDPSTSLKARLWNMYYVKFLKDQGKNFLTLKKLDQLLSECFRKKEYQIKRVFTLRGTYLLATVEPGK